MVIGCDVGFFAPASWIGRVISRATAGGPSHVALALGNGLWLEVSPPQVRIVRESFYRGRSWYAARPPLDDRARMSVELGAMLYTGEDYDELALILLALAPWLRALLLGASGRVCSTVVGSLLSHRGKLVWRNDDGHPLDPRALRPIDLERQRRREGWPVTYESEPGIA